MKVSSFKYLASCIVSSAVGALIAYLFMLSLMCMPVHSCWRWCSAGLHVHWPRFQTLAAANNLACTLVDKHTMLYLILTCTDACLCTGHFPIMQYLHLQGGTLTGRAIARILHGVASPAFPTAQWSKCGFWQQYTNIDFTQVSVSGEHEANIRRQNKQAAGDILD